MLRTTRTSRSEFLPNHPDHDISSIGGPRVQLKRELASLSYDEQVERVAPSATGETTGSSVAEAKKKTKISKRFLPGPNAIEELKPSTFGVVDTESVDVTPTVKKVDGKWKVSKATFVGNYTRIIRLAQNTLEVTGPEGNTTKANHKHQIADLKYYSDASKKYGKDTNNWYMVDAVAAHEALHESRLAPALKEMEPAMISRLNWVHLPAKEGQNESDGKKAIQALPEWAKLVGELRGVWDRKYSKLIANDHDKTPAIEQAVVNPMIKKIEKHAKKKNW